jgi:hypothetical protein
VRHRDDGGSYRGADALAEEDAWAAALAAHERAEALRSAMRDEYADASAAEMSDALEAVLGSMSPAEALSVSRVLDQMSKGAANLVKDPAFIQVARAALPIAGAALGSVVPGAGNALGAGLGNLAASALPGRPAPPPAAEPAAPAPAAPAPAPPAPAPPAPAPAPPAPAPAPAAPAPAPAALAAPAPGLPALPAAPQAAPVPAPSAAALVAGGSAAAAQAMVLALHTDVLRSLLATALGREGCQSVSGIPVAHVLALASHVLGEAAADADQLMYTEQRPDIWEGVPADAAGGPDRWLYADLIGADNRELAQAAEWEGLG